MAGKYIQTGKMKTCVKLDRMNYWKEGSLGEWKTEPNLCVGVNNDYTTFFTTCASDECAWGPDVHMEYQTMEGTVFTLEADCPLSKSNTCRGYVSNAAQHVSPYVIEAQVPASGHEPTYQYTVTPRDPNVFIDNPTTIKALLDEPKCGLLSDVEIARFAANYCGEDGKIYLKNVFSVPELSDEAKLWCVKSSLFLIPQTKAVLSRELVRMALKKQRTLSAGDMGLADRILRLNDDTSHGNISAYEDKQLFYDVNKLILSVGNGVNDVMEKRYLSTMLGALSADQSWGFSETLKSYVSRDIAQDCDERRHDVIMLVEKYL